MTKLAAAKESLLNAQAAELPDAVVAALAAEVEKLECEKDEAKPIGQRLDAAKKRVAKATRQHEQLQEKLSTLKDQIAKNDAEKEASLDELASLTEQAAAEGAVRPSTDAEELMAKALERILDAVENSWPPNQEERHDKLTEATCAARQALANSRSPARQKRKKRDSEIKVESSDSEIEDLEPTPRGGATPAGTEDESMGEQLPRSLRRRLELISPTDDKALAAEVRQYAAGRKQSGRTRRASPRSRSRSPA